MKSFAVGSVMTHARSFTDEDVETFLRLSGDAGRHHATAGSDGRRMAHGLLTATIPTKLGGDINYLAREMHFEFLRPVFTGDVVRCDMTIVEATHEEGRWRLALEGVCRNQQDKEVLRVRTRGVVLDE
jgi:acyl dehydratase